MAMRKYGTDNFKFETIDQTDCEPTVRELETAHIKRLDSYSNGYNCNLGGHGFLVFPEEIKRKISESQKGKVISPESRRRMSEAKRGRTECAEHFGEHTNKGDENPRAKWYIIISPGGECMIGKGVRAFCREHSLLHSKLSSKGKTKGFKLIGTFNDYPEREYAQVSGSATHP